MAEFFNKKEEILEVQLTEYGKHLLSHGKLKPEYYAFFDDEILYNTEYAATASDGTRLTENQNDADRRIRYNTPNLKVIPTRTGAETRVARFIQNVSSSLIGENADPAEQTEAFQQQYFIEKVNFASYPIGTGDMSSDKNASWSVTALKNEISSSRGYIITNPSSSNADINNGVITKIPQINIDVNYKTFFQNGEFSDNAVSGYFETDDGVENIYLSMVEDSLVLEIIEENTVSQKENFEIEVFYEGSITTPTAETNTIQQMTFATPTGNEIAAPKKIQNGTGDVEYYFNLFLDEEIPLELAREARILDRSLSIADNKFRMNRDLYVTEDEEPC